MWKYRMVALTCIAVLFQHVQAKADSQDLGAITCRQLATFKQEKIAVLLAWMDGFWQGNHQQKDFDPEGITDASHALAKHCASHPKDFALSVYGSLRGDD